MKLSELKTGESGVIVKVSGHGGFRKRVIEMGFIKGKKGPFPKQLEMLYEQVETLYEDCELTVIHKPAGLLSVPGKDAAQPSVYALMRRKYPEATGPLIVHRLDMATSGLMIIAKTEFAYHRLQKEFQNHRVQKKYIAIISEKEISGKEISGKDIPEKEIPEKGIISLPLLPDYLNRPRQIVNHEQGKEAITEYEILERIDGSHLRIALYPKTGRTHQLRVHCAHQEGLNAPILGDPLYGKCDAHADQGLTRQFLHSWRVAFDHPVTGERIECRDELPWDLAAVLDDLAPRSLGRTAAGDEIVPQLGLLEA